METGRSLLAAAAALFAVSALSGASWQPSGEEPIARLPPRPRVDGGRAALGAILWSDRRLSRRSTESCATCHDLATNGATGAARDSDDEGRTAHVNTPTIFNVAHSFRFAWRGRVRTLADMVRLSLQSGDATGASEALFERRLRADPRMTALFRKHYGRAPDRAAMIDALTAFVATLDTPDSAFDRWLAGDARAIDNDARRGYQLFKSLGCAACHQGGMAGASMFQKPGVFHPISKATPPLLRVPSLRNVAVTAPYFHDGHVAELGAAVRVMGRAQLDRELSEGEVGQLTAFLRTLTGRYRGRLLRPAAAQ